MEIAILLYKGFTAMDVVGAYEILCRLPGAQVKFIAKEKGIIESEYSGMKMMAQYSLEEIQTADVLLVPGSTYSFMQIIHDKEILQHVQRIHQTTGWTMSVCSGSILLGAAGLLKGKRAATHWALLDTLSKFGAKAECRRYVHDGKIISAADVSAGIDMALYFASLVVDEDYAKMLQFVTEYYPEPPVNINDMEAVPKQIEADARHFLQAEIEKMDHLWAHQN